MRLAPPTPVPTATAVPTITPTPAWTIPPSPTPRITLARDVWYDHGGEYAYCDWDGLTNTPESHCDQYPLYFHAEILEIVGKGDPDNPTYYYRMALWGRPLAVVWVENRIPDVCRSGFPHNLCWPHVFEPKPDWVAPGGSTISFVPSENSWTPRIGDFVALSGSVDGSTYIYTSKELGTAEHGDRWAHEEKYGFYDDLEGREHELPVVQMNMMHMINTMHDANKIWYDYLCIDGQWLVYSHALKEWKEFEP